MLTTDFHAGPPGLSQRVPQGLAGTWGCHLKLPPPTPHNPVPLVSKKCGFTSMGLALETSSWAARGHTQLGVGSANSGELETCRGTPSSHDWRLESHRKSIKAARS